MIPLLRLARFIGLFLASTKVARVASYQMTAGSSYIEESICEAPVQQDLLFGVNAHREMADWICCHNRRLAEHSSFFRGLWDLAVRHKPLGVKTTTFYDSTCGVPLFEAPIGRSVKELLDESNKHGWPSFRPNEIVKGADGKPNIRIHDGGEITSVCGTHLGHNLPDDKGDRYCINLACIAGRGPSRVGGL